MLYISVSVCVLNICSYFMFWASTASGFEYTNVFRFIECLNLDLSEWKMAFRFSLLKIHLEIMQLVMPIRVAYCYSLCVSVIHRMHQDLVIAPFGFGKTKEQPQSMKWTCLSFNPKPPPLSGFLLHSHNLSCLLTLSPAPFTHLLALIFAFEPLWKLRTFWKSIGQNCLQCEASFSHVQG